MMSTDMPVPTTSKKLIWAGRVLSTLPVLLLLFNATMKFIQPEGFPEELKKLELPLHLAMGIGIVELVCTVLYAIPQTAVLGAILLTGYLGGAILTHLRVGDGGHLMPVLVGVVLWLGIFLRERRLWVLMPFRKLAV